MIPQSFPAIPDTFAVERTSLDAVNGGIKLHIKTVIKKGITPKRILFIVHGQSEHGDRYDHFPSFLGGFFDAFFMLDLRGHGRSEGPRGHVDRFDDYLDDVLTGLLYLRERCEPWKLSSDDTTPWVHLFGHSMGGLIVLRLLLQGARVPVSSVSVSSPYLGLKFKVPLLKDRAARMLSRVWGNLILPTGLDPKFVSHDDSVVKAYRQDRLVHGKATPRFYTETEWAIQDLLSRGLYLPASLPVFFQVAGEDQIVDASVTQDFFNHKLRAQHKKLSVYPGLYHEIFNETSKSFVFQDLKSELHTYARS